MLLSKKYIIYSTIHLMLNFPCIYTMESKTIDKQIFNSLELRYQTLNTNLKTLIDRKEILEEIQSNTEPISQTPSISLVHVDKEINKLKKELIQIRSTLDKLHFTDDEESERIRKKSRHD